MNGGTDVGRAAGEARENAKSDAGHRVPTTINEGRRRETGAALVGLPRNLRAMSLWSALWSARHFQQARVYAVQAVRRGDVAEARYWAAAARRIWQQLSEAYLAALREMGVAA